jgi:hypothetical protein
MRVVERAAPAIAVPAPTSSAGQARRLATRLLLALMPLVLAYAATLIFAAATTSFQGRALDFTPYYAAAAALRDNPAANIYDRAVLLRAAAEHPGCLLWPGAAYLYPPLLAILLVPLTYLPYDAAFHLWMALNLALWAVCAALLAYWLHALWRGHVATSPAPEAASGQVPVAVPAQHSPRSSGQDAENRTRRWPSHEILRARTVLLLHGEADDQTLAVLLAVPLAVLTWPVLEGLLMGQVHLLVLLLLLLAPLLIRRGHPFIAGSLLALAVMIKLLPIILIAYYATRGRWRVVLGAALASALLLGVTLLVTGPPAFVNAAVTLGEVSARQGWYGNQALAQLPALLAAAFGWGNAPLVTLAGQITLALTALACARLLLATRRSRPPADDTAELLGYGWAICAMLLLAPLVWIHYNAWLLLPLALCLAHALRARRTGARPLSRRTLPLLATLYALIFLPWSAAIDTLPLGAGPHLLGVALVPLALTLHPLSVLALFLLAGWLFHRAHHETPAGTPDEMRLPVPDAGREAQPRASAPIAASSRSTPCPGDEPQSVRI